MEIVWGDGMWELVGQDFAELPGIAQVLRLVVRLLLAAVLGGVLGYHREREGKAAGLRTHMLVTLGAALFVAASEAYGMKTADLSRVIQGIVTGIGFLGGGAILKLSEERQVMGLTTAAGIWLATAIGVAVGLGRHWSAVLGTVLALLIIIVLQRLEQWLHPGQEKVSRRP